MNGAINVQLCQALLARARSGDPAARSFCARLKARAAAGEYRAQLAWNTLFALYRGASPDTGKLARAFEEMYDALGRKCPQAWHLLRNMQACAASGDVHGMRALAHLKAVHKARRGPSKWYPGAPRVGGWGMPALNRPGIEVPSPEEQSRVVIGASFGYDTQVPQRSLSMSYPIVVGLDIPGLGSVPNLPGLPGGGLPSGPGLPGLPPQVPGVPGLDPSQALGALGGLAQQLGVPGFQPAPPPPPGQFLPLSQAAITSLLSLIANARGPTVFSANGTTQTPGPSGFSNPIAKVNAAQLQAVQRQALAALPPNASAMQKAQAIGRAAASIAQPARPGGFMGLGSTLMQKLQAAQHR